MIKRPTSTEHVLARRGIAGHRQYRIPALAVSPRGTILAAYDGRPNLDDLPNPIDLLIRRSMDNGATWEPQQTVRTGTGLDGYGDPSLLVDTQTQRIFMFHAAGTHAGFFEAVEGLADTDAIQHADLSFSDDDGATWAHRRLTPMLKHEGMTGLFAAAGAGIQIHTGPFTGRLVQQFVVLLRGEIKPPPAPTATTTATPGRWANHRRRQREQGGVPRRRQPADALPGHPVPAHGHLHRRRPQLLPRAAAP